MDAKKAKTPQTCGLYKQLGHNRHSFPNRKSIDRSWYTSWTSHCTVIFLFISIDLNCFKLYVVNILLLFVINSFIFVYIKLLEKKKMESLVFKGDVAKIFKFLIIKSMFVKNCYLLSIHPYLHTSSYL